VQLPAISLPAVIEMSLNQPMPSGGSQSTNGEVWSTLAALLGEALPAPAVSSAPAVPDQKISPNTATILQRNAISSVLARIEVPGEQADVDTVKTAMAVTREIASVPPITLPVDSSPVAVPATAIVDTPTAQVGDAVPNEIAVAPQLTAAPAAIKRKSPPDGPDAVPESVAIAAPVVVPAVLAPVRSTMPVIAYTRSIAAPATPVSQAPSTTVELDTPVDVQRPTAIPDDAAIPPRQEIAFAVRLRDSDTPAAHPVPSAAPVQAQDRTPVLPVQPPLAGDPGEDAHPHDQRPQSDAGFADSLPRAPLERREAPAPIEPAAAAPAPSSPVVTQHAAPAPVHSSPAPILSPAPPRSAPPADPAVPIARATAAAPLPPPAEDAAPQPIRELSIRISDGTSRAADVRISDRAGEVRISVRSADPGLTTSLRDGLSGLASQLDRHPVSAEIWSPAVTSVKASENQQQNPGESRGEPQAGHSGQSNSGNDGGGENPRRQPQPVPDWEDMEPGFGNLYNRYTRT
jgi:hypothetical protein